MVHLISLKMQGIRSIGVEPHAIEFLSPLTLIQGPNGTGKTTIIEALNYVTSGSLPSGKLATFVHDPKVANKTRVDGMVQLKFEDVKGFTVTGTKRMTSSVSKTLAGVTVKSEESTLLAAKDGQEPTAISSKVGDFYTEIMHRLGVNKAVLDYVIFCHQEESNWPLSESKKLKERFDEIFEVSEYVEVLDNIKTERKGLDKLSADLDNEIQNHLKGYVLRSNDLFIEVDTLAKKSESSSAQLKELEDRLKLLEKQLSDAEAKKKKFDKLKSERDIKKCSVQNKEEHIATIAVPNYNGSIAELQEELDEAENEKDYKQVKSQQDKIDKEIAKIVEEMEKIQDESAQLQKQINDLEVQKQRKADLKKEKEELDAKMRRKYEIAEDENIEEAMTRIKEDKENQKKELLASFKVQRDQITQDFNAANVAIANVEATKRSKEADINRFQREISKIEKELEQIGASTQRSNKLEKEIAKLESDLEDEQPLSVLEKESMNRQVAMVGTKSEIEDFSKVISAENDLKKKSGELESQMKKSKNDLADLFSTPVQRNFYRQLTTLKMDLEKGHTVAEKSLSAVETELQKITSKLHKLNIKNECNENIVKENKEQISQIGVEPDEVKEKLDRVREDLKEYRDQLGEKQGSQFLFKKWEEQIAKEKNCPLCEKACGTSADVQKLVTKVKKRHADLPSEIEELNESVAKFVIQERELTQVLPLVEKMESLLNQTAEDLNEIGEIEKQKASKEKDKEMARKKLEEARRKLDSVKNILGDAKLLDKLVEDKKAAEEYVTSARENMSDFDKAEWTLEQMEEAREEAQSKIEKLEADAEKVAAKLKEIRTKTARLQELKEEKLKIGEKALQPAILSKSKEEKDARIAECQEEIASCSEQLPALKNNQKKVKADLDKANQSLESKKSEFDTFLNRFSHDSETFKKCNARLANTSLDEKDQRKLVQKMNGFVERRSELERKKIQFETEKVNASNKEQKVKILKDQLNKKTYQDEVATLNGELLELQEQLEGSEGIEKEIRKTRNRYEECNNKKHTLIAQQQPMKDAIRSAKRQLAEPNIEKAGENYLAKYSEKCLTEEMSRDLETYLKCLDDAIIAFHTIKMERINILLAEHWTEVYDGNDIEGIRIKSDPVGGTDKRKSYNYSVVMIVDGKELEMRDRCSAGQKVLASILIRIVLAEVFASNCPIIALDEPTTNLDTEKIDNVGNMLTKLVHTREDSLQLIVITHDVQLVKLLHHSCRPEFVYGLEKNEYGISKLRRHTKLIGTIIPEVVPPLNKTQQDEDDDDDEE